VSSSNKPSQQHVTLGTMKRLPIYTTCVEPLLSTPVSLGATSGNYIAVHNTPEARSRYSAWQRIARKHLYEGVTQRLNRRTGPKDTLKLSNVDRELYPVPSMIPVLTLVPNHPASSDFTDFWCCAVDLPYELGEIILYKMAAVLERNLMFATFRYPPPKLQLKPIVNSQSPTGSTTEAYWHFLALNKELVKILNIPLCTEHTEHKFTGGYFHYGFLMRLFHLYPAAIDRIIQRENSVAYEYIMPCCGFCFTYIDWCWKKEDRGK
jgi:hypothetical protein